MALTLYQPSHGRKSHDSNRLALQNPRPLRIALYWPGEPEPVEILEDEFGPSPEDRKVLLDAMWQIMEQPDDGLQVRIIAEWKTDLKLFPAG